MVVLVKAEPEIFSGSLLRQLATGRPPPDFALSGLGY